MANIAHAWVRLFSDDGFTDELVAGTIKTLFPYNKDPNNYRKESYNVPLHVQKQHRYLDIQFGDRYSSKARITRLWERLWNIREDYYKDYLSEENDELPDITSANVFTVFYRHHYAHGGPSADLADFDIIGSFSIEDEWEIEDRLCSYGFDGMTAVWTKGYDWPEAFKIKLKNGWYLDLSGSYHAMNYRTRLLHSPGLATPTTGADFGFCREIGHKTFDFDWEWINMPQELIDIDKIAYSKAHHIEFSYNYRVVKYYERCIDSAGRVGWRHTALDHWDNCVDPTYLAYKQHIGLDE